MRPIKSPILGHSLTTLTNGLRIAAERFDADALEFRRAETATNNAIAADPNYLEAKEAEGGLILNPHPNFYKTMAEQFERQAKETRELLARIDTGPDGDEDFMGEITLEITYAPEDDAGPFARP